MSVKLEIRDRKYAIVAGDKEILLTEEELRDLNQSIDEIWFEKDVRDKIEKEGWLFKEDTVGEIVDTYCHLRHKNDGDSEGMTWDECLDEAFEGHEYGDKLTDSMWEVLKAKLMEDRRLAAEFLEVTNEHVLSLTETDLADALDCTKSEMEDCDLVEWYTDVAV